MQHLEDSVTIDAPIDKVFSYVVDFSNTAKWHKNMKKVGFKISEPPQLGSQYDWIESFAGKTMDLSGEITAWDPPHAFAWKPDGGPFRITGGWTFVADGAATTVTRYSDSDLSGIMKFLSVLMVPVAKRQVRQELAELKRLIEARND